MSFKLMYAYLNTLWIHLKPINATVKPGFIKLTASNGPQGRYTLTFQQPGLLEKTKTLCICTSYTQRTEQHFARARLQEPKKT